MLEEVEIYYRNRMSMLNFVKNCVEVLQLQELCASCWELWH